jgi:hypothetical protein
MKSCHFVAHLFTNLLQSSNVVNSGRLLYSLKLAYISRFFWPTMGIHVGFFMCFFCWQFFSQFEKQCWIICGRHVDVDLVCWLPLAMPLWTLDIDDAHFLYSIVIYYQRKLMKLIADDHHLHTHELVPNLLQVLNESSMKFKHSRYAKSTTLKVVSISMKIFVCFSCVL